MLPARAGIRFNRHMDKDLVADILREIGLLLQLKGENPFKSRAYERAAEVVETFQGDLGAMAAADRLGELPGIGDAIRKKLTELLLTGRLPYHEKLRAEFPAGVFDLLRIEGLGPRRVGILFEKLRIDSPDALERACEADQIASLKGFGPATQAKLLDGIRRLRQYRDSYRLGEFQDLVGVIRSTLRGWNEISQLETAGETRRGCEVVQELTFLASTTSPDAVLDRFCRLPDATTISKDAGSAVVFLKNLLPCRLCVTSEQEFPWRLIRLTGSMAHLDDLAARAKAGGADLLEDGFNPASGSAIRCEADVYAHLGLQTIPPEMREGQGEVEAAIKGKLPRLLEWTDLRGTLHVHTTASDGRDSLEKMVDAAHELGMEYIGIADHSRSSAQAKGLDPKRLLQQVREIGALNANLQGIRVLAGTEVDILKDGSLDFPDEILAGLDYAVASVHARFALDEDSMTRRIIRAAENPYVTMLGHLTGRLLLERPPYPVDVIKIIDACAATGTWIEFNANPRRLDMDWRFWKYARDKGVMAVINPDAHSRQQLGYLRFGVTVARKGWLTKSDVANTRPLPAFLELLKAKRLRFSKGHATP